MNEYKLVAVDLLLTRMNVNKPLCYFINNRIMKYDFYSRDTSKMNFLKAIEYDRYN